MGHADCQARPLGPRRHVPSRPACGRHGHKTQLSLPIISHTGLKTGRGMGERAEARGAGMWGLHCQGDTNKRWKRAESGSLLRPALPPHPSHQEQLLPLGAGPRHWDPMTQPLRRLGPHRPSLTSAKAAESRMWERNSCVGDSVWGDTGGGMCWATSCFRTRETQEGTWQGAEVPWEGAQRSVLRPAAQVPALQGAA